MTMKGGRWDKEEEGVEDEEGVVEWGAWWRVDFHVMDGVNMAKSEIMARG